MGYPSASGDMTFNAEKLEKLLRHAKVTQQSIQTVSTWILDRRAWLNDTVDLWVKLLRESAASHQIVYLYIANDTMQVGVRKYGKHIAEIFEARLLEVVQYVMNDCDEKVKRCMIKIIGIWKERHTVTPALLDMLQNVCAGKPPVPDVPVKETLSAEDHVRSAHEAFLQEIDSNAVAEEILMEMTEMAEWDATAVMNQCLQDVVSATISADLLSDRMFQLESSLSTFQHAIEAYNDAERRADTKDSGEIEENEEKEEQEQEEQEKSAGDLVWEMLDQQVFDVDVERSREHVQLYRDNLEAQNAKREDLIQHLESLALLDPFADPIFHTSPLLRNQQAESLERLHIVCLKAEILAKEREALRPVSSYTTGRPPLMPTSASPRRGGSIGSGGGQDSSGRSHQYRSSSSEPMESFSSSSPSSSYSQQASPHHRSTTVHRRYSSVDTANDYHNRYGGSTGGGGGGGDSDHKRAKLQHSQSLDDHTRRERPSRWDQSPRGYERPKYHSRGPSDGGASNSNYGGYNDHHYQDRAQPSPRHHGDVNSPHHTNHDQGSSRWEANSFPPHDDGRRDQQQQRRW